ncbi:MAG: type II secretion system protein [Candidatus Eremiobacteraeota bacterium]|nr:type II secretion system protein [Candidatus Eremiobacteraeota bacterium]
MHKRAFTLVETLITVALVSLVFGLFMMLLRDSFRLTRRMSSKDEARRATQVALDRMLTEARESARWTAPNRGTNVSEATAIDHLELTKVNANDATRCPLAPDSYPSPQALLPGALGWLLQARPAYADPWDPQQNAHSQHVLYHLVGADLVREVGPGGGTTLGSPMVLSTGLRGLQCWAEPGDLLVVVLSYPESQVIQRITGRAVCPGLERN